MKPESENTDLELKKYEELYSLTKTELEKGHARFLSVEEKANKYFSLLVILLGFISFGIPEYVLIVKNPLTYWHSLFAFVYPLLIISVFVSIFYYMKAISFSKYKNMVLDKEMFEHFKKHKYIDVIHSMSKRIADDLRIINEVTEIKIKHASIAFRFTQITLLFIIPTIAIYIIIKLQ